jgi:uncharacterized damage-inducible protein DinB
MNANVSRTAVVALLDEHERAMKRLLAFIKDWDDEKLERTVLDNPKMTYRHVLQHVASAAYVAYFVWIQRVLGWEIVQPAPEREAIQKTRALGDLRSLLRETVPYGQRALANLTNRDLAERHQSNWNQPYTIDQMLEHGVVHVWRHLRQLERAEAAASPS